MPDLRADDPAIDDGGEQWVPYSYWFTSDRGGERRLREE
jgi:hypothetical protein